MKTIDLKKVEKIQLDDILNMTQTESVVIRGRDERTFFLLSEEQFEQLEDAYWAVLADQAIVENDWMSVEESKALLQRKLDARGQVSEQS